MSRADDVRAWLRERGTERIAHAGGSLYEHLGRVSARLAGHGAGEVACLAALTHAAYGTDGFPMVLLDVTDRAGLRALVGAEAEEMVYRYGGCDRGRTWRALPATGLIWSRFTAHAEAPTPDGLRAFVDLSIVNELDVYERSEEIAAKAGDYFRSVFPLWEPIASPSVMADCRRVLGI
jgi:pimeloyl-ACP methyl ester carboxylesterase